MTERAVLTGRGVASPLGGSWPAFARALRDGVSAPVGPFPGAAVGDPPPCHPLVPPAGFDGGGRAEPLGALAAAVAREALTDAGIDLSAPPFDDIGLVMSTVLGPSGAVEAYLERLAEKGPRASRPAQFVDTLPSMPGSRVGIALGLRGSTAVIGGSSPFELALDWLRSGRAHAVVAGGGDLVSPKCARYLQELAARAGGRPLLAPAAAFAALESEARARERGAKALASLIGAGAASEPQDVALPWSVDPEGRAFADAMRDALADAGVGTRDVRTVALASGDDAAEAGERVAVGELFGDASLALLRPKRALGEGLAASAGLALLATLALAGHGVAVVNAFEMGGAVTSLVLELP